MSASAWFTLTAGWTIRGPVRREIEKAAWSFGLDIKTEESKGFLESAYRFTVTGDEDRVCSFMPAVQRWLHKIETA